MRHRQNPAAMSEQTYREAVTAVIFAAAWADGQVGEQEQVALTRILARLGYPEPEREALVAQALIGPSAVLPIEVSADATTAIEIMRYALAVMLADGLLSQEEVNFVVGAAARLKIDSATLSALGREAEKLLAQIGSDTASAVDRVEALLPESRPKLPQDPRDSGGQGLETAGRQALAPIADSCDGALEG